MTITVPAQTPEALPPIKLAFVAEAPSDEEMRDGVPLVGPSGRIFNSLLRTAGIQRSEVLVTNVFDTQLPGNDVGAWCVGLADARGTDTMLLPPIGDSGFLHSSYHHHLDRLAGELEHWRPNVIVPLGGTALWALTGSPRIGNVRGTVLPATHLVPGAKLVPTYHPAFLMKQWKFFTVVAGDFIKAQYEADRGPLIQISKKELHLEPTLTELAQLRPLLLASDLLSVDIETGWGQITCIGFAWDAGNAVCIPFLDKRQPDRNYWRTAGDEMAAWQFVREVMEHPVPKLGQNFGAYDAYWLLVKQHVAPRNYTHDTRLIHHSLYPELPKDLQFMGAGYTDQGAWKHWGRASQEKRDA